MDELGRTLGRHGVSLFNGIYTFYILALSRHLPDLSLQDFPSVTCVTSRLSPGREDLMGCLIHTPLLRFRLDPGATLLEMMKQVQSCTRDGFHRILTDSAGTMRRAGEDPDNLQPFLTRNVFLYRSPEEVLRPPPGWASYRNEFFYEDCDVGLYFDVCASPQDGIMEGYLLGNLNYCGGETLDAILRDLRKLLAAATADEELLSRPAGTAPPGKSSLDAGAHAPQPEKP